MLEINKNPSRRDLFWFGPFFALAFAIVGLLLFFSVQARTAAIAVWAVAGVVTIAYYAAPPLRRRIYVGWMVVTYPIGWVVSHVMLALIYYVVLTPTGLVMRLLGRDPMQRRFEKEAKSYWIERKADADPGRYFKQY